MAAPTVRQPVNGSQNHSWGRAAGSVKTGRHVLPLSLDLKMLLPSVPHPSSEVRKDTLAERPR